MSTGTALVTERGVLDSLLASLAQTPSRVVPTQSQWLKTLRAQALKRVDALTLPTTHDEAWRFTSLAALARQSFHPLRTPTVLQPGDIEHLHIEEATTRLVFVDGVHAPQLSSVSSDASLVVGALASMLATQASSIEQHLGQHAAFHDALFAALNTAFLIDAAVLIVPYDTALATPVHVLFISTQPDVASHPRLLLVAGAGSKVTLIEDYVALHPGAYFTNSVAEVAEPTRLGMISYAVFCL